MAVLIKKYNINKNRLTRGFFRGFHIAENGAILSDINSTEETVRRSIFLPAIDSNQSDCIWGRLVFDSQIDEESVLLVRVFASNNKDFVKGGALTSFNSFLLNTDVPLEQKLQVFTASSGSKFLGDNDVLLYEQVGRYLWIYVEVHGSGSAKLENFKVYAPGDNFFNTFPEIYRRNGEFLHRYLSVFSSMYSDLQTTINSFDEYIDIDTAPAALLPTFAEWMGINLDGDFLEDEYLRQLLRIAFSLIKKKGTRQAIEDIVNIFIEEKVYLVEQRMVYEHMQNENRRVNQALYGKNPFGFTILINRMADEKLHSKLTFLINQFKPLRSRVNIVFIGEGGGLDSHCYMDINSRVFQVTKGYLDRRASLGGIVVLQ